MTASVTTLTLELADRIIARALEHAADTGVAPLTVVVLDDAGHLIAARRQDGASMFRFDIAVGKAWAAVAMGSSSRELAARAADNPRFFDALSASAGGRFLPQPGAVLVRDPDGTVLGSVGASGGTGDQDEACCTRGLDAAAAERPLSGARP